MKTNPYLTQTESLAIDLLAQGKRLKDIRDAVTPEVKPMYFHNFLASLRMKTGIKDTQSIEQCAAYRSHIEQLPVPTLSPREVKLLEHLIAGRSPAIVAGMLAITPQEAQEQTEATLLKCGILAQDARTRRAQARMYFLLHGNPNNHKPAPSPTHVKILRNLADGKPANFGLGNLIDGKAMAAEACHRINATCPGRNAQQKLIRAWIAQHDSTAMDDPMF